MKIWKIIAITLICFLALVVIFNLIGKPPKPGQSSSSQNETTSAYLAFMEEQRKLNLENHEKAMEILRKAEVINELSLRNQQRFEKIIDRWEKQADHMDKTASGSEKRQIK